MEKTESMQLEFSINETEDGLIVNGIKKNSAIEEKIIIPSKALFNGKVYPVTEIGKKAFYGGKITSVVMPDSVQFIDDNAFYCCENLTSVSIPNSVRVISDWAFSGCGLSSIYIGKNVSKIAVSAFFGNSLEKIMIDKDNQSFDSRDNCNAIINTTENELVVGCNKTAIPKDITSIGELAFCTCKSMSSIVIPDNIIYIKKEAFKDCESLSNVVIPESVIAIGKGAFAGCSELSSVVIPNLIKKIEDSTFEFCHSLTSIVIPDTVKTIGNYAFNGSALTSITIPDSVTSIGEYAFAFCRKLTEVEVGNSLKVIPKRAFYGCEALKKSSIKKIVQRVSEVEEEAFKECSLKSEEIPEVLSNAFQKNGVMPETILEVVFHAQGLTRYGERKCYSEESSILNEQFFYWGWVLDMIDQVEEYSLTMRYKKDELLESFVLNLIEEEDLIDVLRWMEYILFAGKMKGKHELSTWFRGKKQEELADYVAGDTVNINDFRYPLRVSKVVVSSKDIEKTVSGFSDLYNQRGYEISKRGYRVPTFEEWIHFANSIEGQGILEKQYNGKDAYEVCMVDAKTILHVNVKSHKLAVLDYEYRRTHPGPLREGYYRYVLSPIAEKDLFPEGFVNKEAVRLWGEAEAEYEEYLERREPWDC